MADAVLATPVKQFYWMARLLWGDPDFYSKWYLTNANEDLIAGPPPTNTQALFEGTPLFSVTGQANSGTFEQKSWQLDVPYTTFHSTLLDPISSGRAKPQILVTLWEYHLGEDGEVQILTHLVGKVARVVRNPGGKQALVRFEVVTIKNDIKRALGVQAQPFCQWKFGDVKTCGLANLASLREGGSLDAIDGLVATITGLSAQPERYWHRGYIEKDGIRILIKEWVSGDTFILGKFIPFSWEEVLPGVTVTVTPGCDKSIQKCEFWERRIPSFSGYGRAIPAYNPTLGTS